jgi:hypothetical protein
MSACAPEPAGDRALGTSGSTATVTFPAGNPAAGRQAFVDLKCSTCHAVPSEASFPAPISANPGPPMDRRVGRYDASYLITSMTSPSHAFSTATGAEVRALLEGRAPQSGQLSPMGDFSGVMTVRQLIDLQAFLQSIE